MAMWTFATGAVGVPIPVEGLEAVRGEKGLMALEDPKGETVGGLVARTAAASHRGGPRIRDGCRLRYPQRRVGLRGLV